MAKLFVNPLRVAWVTFFRNQVRRVFVVRGSKYRRDGAFESATRTVPDEISR